MEPEAPTSCASSSNSTQSSDSITDALTYKLQSMLDEYFSDTNLETDFLLLKNINMDGYVPLKFLMGFRDINMFTSDIEALQMAIVASSALEMNQDGTHVKRTLEVMPKHTYLGSVARLVIVYNFPATFTEKELNLTFSNSGYVEHIDVVKNGVSQWGFYPHMVTELTCFALVLFGQEQSATHAVKTLTDTSDWRKGMQVTLYDGTTADKIKGSTPRVCSPTISPLMERRRAHTIAVNPSRPTHVDAVGEGLSELQDGKPDTGVIFSIRGQGGLITPTKFPDTSISFRLIPTDNEDGLQEGDQITFTVGTNKKSGRKYASRIRLIQRPSTSSTASTKDYFAPSSADSWISRRRALTMGGTPPRARANTIGTPLPTPLRRPRGASFGGPDAVIQPRRQAKGPDGTNGFASGRGKKTVETRLRTLSISRTETPPAAI